MPAVDGPPSPRRVVQALIRAPDSNVSIRRVSSQPSSSSFYGSQPGPTHDKSVAHPQMRLQYMLTCVWRVAALHGVAVCALRGTFPVTRKPGRTRRRSPQHPRVQALPHRCTLSSAHALPAPKTAPVRTRQMRAQVPGPDRTVNRWRKHTVDALRTVLCPFPTPMGTALDVSQEVCQCPGDLLCPWSLSALGHAAPFCYP